MPSILQRDTFDSFTVGCALLITSYVLSFVLLVAQYEGALR
jgi:hypothetical protein